LLTRSGDNIATGIIAKIIEIEVIAKENFLLGWFHLMRHLYAQLHGINFRDVVLRMAEATSNIAGLLLLLLSESTFGNYDILVYGVKIVF